MRGPTNKQPPPSVGVVYTDMKNRIRNASKMFGLALAAGLATAHAAVPTEITDITTNADTVFSTVKTIIVGVVGFMILVSFVKMVKKK